MLAFKLAIIVTDCTSSPEFEDRLVGRDRWTCMQLMISLEEDTGQIILFLL